MDTKPKTVDEIALSLAREYRVTRALICVVAILCVFCSLFSVSISSNKQSNIEDRIDALTDFDKLILDGTNDPNDELIRKLKEIYYRRIASARRSN